MKRLAPAVALALLLVGFSKRADAGPGVRVGLVDHPDSIFAGFFYEIPIGAAGPGVFVLDPGVDLGLGLDDPVDFTLRGQLNVKYFIPINQFYLYPLLGLSVMYVNYDNDRCGRFNDDCDDTDAGLNIGLGFAFLERFNLELYATAADDVPDLTFSFGFSF
jgi:hypothetical protein